MSDVQRRIAENLAQVRGLISASARRSGRTAEAITLVAVTKSAPASWAAALVAEGCACLGEGRPQELWSKFAEMANPAIRWHLIGHLQRNKIRRTLPLLSCVQSVDSERLLTALDDEAAMLARRLDVLLEVKISVDTAKTGLSPELLEPLLNKAATLRHLSVHGLMCMASLTGGPSTARRDFAQLRKLRDRLVDHCPPEVALGELSMGMSGDFEIAIEEGATIVRVGSALFEGVG